MGFIDVDSHVLENEETWSYLSAKDVQYRPTRIQLPAAHPGAVKGAAAPPVSIWMVGDTWVTAAPVDGNMRNNANIYDPGVVNMNDAAARVEDLNGLGIDVQLLLSTFFLGVELDNPAAEVAISRSYNRWLSDRIPAEHRQRLPWAVRAPMRSVPAAIEQINFGKANGAAGVQVRGLEHAMYLTDSFFDPIWQHVNDLEMAVFVHLGDATRRIDGQALGRTIANPAAMMRQLFPLMAGFHAILASDFHKRFPNIRWGFLEGGAGWAPVVLQMDTRLRASAEEFLSLHPRSPEELEEKRLFISIEADDPIGNLSEVIGENILVAGTDYGHNDRGTEIGAHTFIAQRQDVSPSFAQKVVDTSGRKLLAVKDDFQPATAAAVERGYLPHTRGAQTPHGEPVLIHTGR